MVGDVGREIPREDKKEALDVPAGVVVDDEGNDRAFPDKIPFSLMFDPPSS